MQDFKVDPVTNAPVIINGDFALEDSLLTDARMVMEAATGDWKQDPVIGLSLYDRINGPNSPAELVKLDKDIRTQMDYCGIPIAKIDINTTPITVDING